LIIQQIVSFAETMHSGRKKLLWIAGWYPSRHRPALGNFIQRHAQAAALHHDITIVHVAASDTHETLIKKENNITAVIVYFKRHPILPVRFLRWKQAWHEGLTLAIQQMEGKLDAVHLHIIIPVGFIALPFCRQWNRPLFITEHSTRLLSPLPLWQRFVIKKVCARAHTICPVTDHLAKALQRLGITTPMMIIPNVVDTSLFKPVKKTFTGRKKILHVSTLNERQKNISGMLRAIKQLSLLRNDFEVEIISEYDYSHAEAYARQLALDNGIIRFRGLQPMEEIARAMQQATVLVLFSNAENLPCVLLEAVACGTPVISTNVGGISEWITPACGILIEKGNEQQLVESLQTILNVPEHFNPTPMHEYIHKHCSMEAIGKQFDELYSSIG
jgi:glycosyltransferase involved in cell wall biosynthesis